MDGFVLVLIIPYDGSVYRMRTTEEAWKKVPKQRIQSFVRGLIEPLAVVYYEKSFLEPFRFVSQATIMVDDASRGEKT